MRGQARRDAKIGRGEGMAEEIQEAVQIIRVGYDGIDIAMRIGGGTIEQMKNVIDFLIAVLDHEKTMGKESMRKLLMKGGDLQVLQFGAEDMKRVEKLAKKYGLLYSVLPDVNKKDGMREIVFHTEAVPRANMMLQKLRAGRIATFDDYLKNGDGNDMAKAIPSLKGQKRGNGSPHTEEAEAADGREYGLIEKAGLYAVGKPNVSVGDIKEKFSVDDAQAEDVLGSLKKLGILEKGEDGLHKAAMDKGAFLSHIQGYKDLAGRMRAVSAAQGRELIDITIAKELVEEENGHAVKTRVPGTWGEDVRYLWLDKENIMEIHSGKTLLSSLDQDKDYNLYSSDNRVAATMKGGELYDSHYDKVSEVVRKRYAEAGLGAAIENRKIAAQKTPVPKGR